MELKFSIDDAQLRRVAARANAAQAARDEQLIRRINPALSRACMLWFPQLSFAVVAVYFNGSKPETYIVLFVWQSIYLLLWRLWLHRWVQRHDERFTPPKPTFLNRMADQLALYNLRRLKGCYSAIITPEALLLRIPAARLHRIPWTAVHRVKQDDEFLHLTICSLGILKMHYLISKSGEALEGMDYQAGLAQMLSYIPVEVQAAE